jgi:phage baseplate assembly protein W
MSVTTDPRGKEFMGRGWAFPVRIMPDTGRIATALHEADIQQSIRIILGTAKGERVMRPEFGCGIHDLVFAAIDMATITQIKHDVTEALLTYEARIDLLAVTVDRGPLLDGRLDIAVDYRVRTTNQADNYVYPFYFKEAR